MTDNVYPISYVVKKTSMDFSFELKILAKNEETLEEIWKKMQQQLGDDGDD